MSSSPAEDDNQHTRDTEEVESPRKKMRLDNSGRKSWSLIDRKADFEVLLEMGVNLLEPDDDDMHEPSCSTNLPHKPTAKRKRDIENVNPNSYTGQSPRSKLSPRSPKIKLSSPGPSKGRSPRSLEQLKPLQPSDPNLLETTLTTEYLIDEETPLGQSVGAHYKPTATSGLPVNDKKKDWATLKEQRKSLSKCDPQGPDSFAILSDEMMLSVFRWLPKRTLATAMLVCKRWYRVAGDETLWQRLDLGNKNLNKDALGKILARKPLIVRLASSEVGQWHPTSQSTPSRIQYLDLSMVSIDKDTLDSLLALCPRVKKLSLENLQLRDTTCSIIGRCEYLETLNLTMAQGITAGGLSSLLEGCLGLLALNISWCGLDEAALNVLVNSLPPRLQRLNLGGARILTDDMVGVLCKQCSRLLELDLSDCSSITAFSILSMTSLQKLEHLALSRCYLLPAQTLTNLSHLRSLQYLEVWGMLPSHSLNLLKEKLAGIQINQFMFSAIARPTVGNRRTSIWGLRTRD